MGFGPFLSEMRSSLNYTPTLVLKWKWFKEKDCYGYLSLLSRGDFPSQGQLVFSGQFIFFAKELKTGYLLEIGPED